MAKQIRIQCIDTDRRFVAYNTNAASIAALALEYSTRYAVRPGSVVVGNLTDEQLNAFEDGLDPSINCAYICSHAMRSGDDVIAGKRYLLTAIPNTSKSSLITRENRKFAW
jgi:hypothetical protein